MGCGPSRPIQKLYHTKNDATGIGEACQGYGLSKTRVFQYEMYLKSDRALSTRDMRAGMGCDNWIAIDQLAGVGTQTMTVLVLAYARL